MTQQDKLRAAFEAAYSARHEVYDSTFIFFNKENRYQRPAVDEAWWAWQAAVEYASQTRSSPLEDYVAKVQPLIRENGTIALSDLKTLMPSTNRQAQQEGD